jgi:hypothetical protein
MPDVVWALNWAVLGLVFAVYAARRAWLQQRLAKAELAAVRSYGELREGEYASIEGIAAKPAPGAFEVVMEGNRVRVERAKVDAEALPSADEILAVEADRPVFVSGIVERVPGGFAIRAAPGRRMAVSAVPLWRRAARRRLAHVLVAFVVAAGTIEAFRFLAWDELRLTVQGEKVHATLSNAREVDAERFSFRDLNFRKVRRIRLDADYVDDRGAPRRFTTDVDPRTEWLWSLTADQAEVRRLGIEPVVQTFVVIPHDPSVHQLGDRVRLDAKRGLVPLAVLVLLSVAYWLLLVRPELPRRSRRPRGRLVAPPGPAA